MGEYEVVAQWRPPLARADARLRLVFDRAFNRVPHPDARLEARIGERWEEKLRAKGSGVLWNATKFRLAEVAPPRTAPGGDGVVTLRLGITDYREYQGTNVLTDRPLDNFGDERHLSNSLGNACVVQTSDHRVVFLARSSRVGEGEGAMVLPGGHPEPANLGIDSLDWDVDCLPPEKVEEELFDSVVAEVIEEVGVKHEELSLPSLTLLGITRRTRDRKSQLVAQLSCVLSSAQIRAQWQPNDESDRIYFLPIEDLHAVLRVGSVDGVALMPEHLGAVALFVANQPL